MATTTDVQPSGGPATPTTVRCRPREGRASHCRDCGMPVFWFETVEGKWMPMDTDLNGWKTVDAPDGLAWEVEGVPHWVTCARR